MKPLHILLVLLLAPAMAFGQCPSPSGDQVTYGSGSWIGYVYDGADNFSSDYYGFITRNQIFNESFAGDSLTTSDCTLELQTFSIRFRMNETFTCNTYAITIGGDDGVRLSLDGGSTYAISGYVNQPYTTYTDTFLLDGNYDMVLEWFENGGSEQVSFDITAIGNTSDGGIIGSDQDFCTNPVDPAAFTSTSAAAFCTGSPSYQWQISSDNVTFSNISGATSETYDAPNTFPLGNTRYYRRCANNGTDTVYSNTVTVISDTALGDQVTYGSGSWIGYVYDGADNYTDYQGFITETEMFDESFTGSNTTHVINGCDINTETFTVRFRMNQTFACADYTFTIGADDGVRLSLDGGSTYFLTDYSNHGYRTTSGTINLSGNYDLVLEYYENSGGNRVTFDYTSVVVIGNGGDIEASQAFCSGSAVDPAAFTSTTPASFCSGNTPNYQWQVSSDNVSFTDIASANSETYDLTTYPTADTMHYRRRAHDGTDTVYSDTVTVENQSVQGDQVTYGSGSWIGYVYDGADNFTDYQGFVTESEIFDQNFGSSAGTYSINGCDVTTTTFTVRYRMNQSFASGSYDITIGGDDGVRLSIDGGSTYLINGWSNQAYTTYNTTTNLSGNYDLVLEYYENSGDNRVSFTYSLNAGTTWDGSSSTDWANADNWSSGVPDCTVDVVIPASAPNMPTISASAAVRSIIIESGASLTISGSNTLTVCGDWNNQGSFTANSSTVTFPDQTAARTIQCSATQAFYNLDLNDALGTTLSGSTTQINGKLSIADGDLATNSLLTLNSDVNGTGWIGSIPTGHSVTGAVTVERFIQTTTGYNLLASPVTSTTLAMWDDNLITTGFTGSDFPGFSFNNVQTYDETVLGDKDNNGWSGASNITDAVAVGTGVMWYIGPDNNVTFDAVGTLNQGTINFPITYTDDPGQPATQDGWNMVGNPYPSSIDWSAGSGWTKTNVNDAIYVWRDDIDQFASYVSGAGSNGGTQYIPSSQGFWVQTNASSPALSCTEEVKSDSASTFFKADPGEMIRLVLSDSAFSDESVVRFIPGAEYGFDSDLDARKLESFNPQVLSLSSWGADSTECSVNSQPLFTDSIYVPVQAKVPATGTYWLAITQSTVFSHELVLEDRLTGQTWLVDDLPGIMVTLYDTVTTARFAIRMNPKEEVPDPDPVSVAEEQGPQLNVSPNPFGNELTLRFENWSSTQPVTVRLTDLRGAVVHEQVLTPGPALTLNLDHLPAGAYLLTTQDADRIWRQKVVKTDR